ncbi:cystathionine beta-lyase [Microcella putealis]|uniref:cysteine-S-conjugate beta-lyase n=1 Tax=Microcella putealis TaxID=337005 RepID=A0A4Q7LNU4_9MICO|nr:cystathionine beta-lyase [Microcella putealis]TQM27139.1 cystathionine beta-lyase [Microcella putealis]
MSTPHESTPGTRVSDVASGALDAAALHAQWDAITATDLHARGGMKWAANPGMIGAWVAESDLGTDSAVTAALHAAVDKGEFGYLPPPLAAELREATAAWMRERFDWDVAPARIQHMPDVIHGLSVAIDLFTPAGSPVIVPTPAYMPFLTVPPRHGRAVIEVPHVTDARGEWSFDLAAIDAALGAGARLVVLCNPHNPGGKVFSRDELAALAEVVARHDGARVFADEVHAPILVGEQPHVPYASVSDAAARQALTATSASKAFTLPGVKCAQLIITNDDDQRVVAEQGPLFGHGTSTLGVVANIAAYRDGGPWLDAFNSYLRGTIASVAERLEARIPSARFVRPAGSYIGWIDLRETPVPGGADPRETDLGQWFREHARVALTDGRACGAAGAGGVRMILATPAPIALEAIDRMADALTGA